jgi:hypothetical protein
VQVSRCASLPTFSSAQQLNNVWSTLSKICELSKTAIPAPSLGLLRIASIFEEASVSRIQAFTGSYRQSHRAAAENRATPAEPVLTLPPLSSAHSRASAASSAVDRRCSSDRTTHRAQQPHQSARISTCAHPVHTTCDSNRTVPQAAPWNVNSNNHLRSSLAGTRLARRWERAPIRSSRNACTLIQGGTMPPRLSTSASWQGESTWYDHPQNQSNQTPIYGITPTLAD